MDPATVQALRDVKSLFDEGILDEDEFKTKKKELLAAAKPQTARAAAAAPVVKAEGKAEGKVAKAGKFSACVEVRCAGEKGVLVTGPGTFKAKALLSELGGSWSKSLKAWVCCASAQHDDSLRFRILRSKRCSRVQTSGLRGSKRVFAAGKAGDVASGLRASTAPVVEVELVEGEGDAMAAREQSLAAATAASLDTKGAKANATLEVGPHKKAVVVRGETKKVAEVLRALGGSWNRSMAGWVFPGKMKDSVVEALRADATNSVTVDGEQPAQAQAAAENAARAQTHTPPPPPDEDATSHAEPKSFGVVKEEKGGAKSKSGRTAADWARPPTPPPSSGARLSPRDDADDEEFLAESPNSNISSTAKRNSSLGHQSLEALLHLPKRTRTSAASSQDSLPR